MSQKGSIPFWFFLIPSCPWIRASRCVSQLECPFHGFVVRQARSLKLVGQFHDVLVLARDHFDEIAGNIGGKEHRRFVDECKAAKAAGCKLVILVENTLGITDISQVHTWINPRAIYSPGCIQGPRLQKAMETISERYNVTFLFCSPEESGAVIMGVLEKYGYKQRE